MTFKKGYTPWNKGLKNPYSDSTIQKMRDSHKGQIPHNKGKTGILSEEQKQKLIEGRKRTPTWNKGVPLSAKTKEKLSAKLKGRPTHLGCFKKDPYLVIEKNNRFCCKICSNDYSSRGNLKRHYQDKHKEVFFP
jgi:hypothetical protein